MVRIYSPSSCYVEIPDGYQAVIIPLQASIKADLDWKNEKEWASQLIEKGFSIFWELQLGLFSGLPRSLSNKTQFLSLGLSLEHFLQNIWEAFQAHTIGVSLYKGDADFSRDFPWDEEYHSQFQQWLEEKFDDVEKLNSILKSPVQSFSEADPRNTWPLASLFCRNAAADYLDLLAGHMSQILPLYALLDATAVPDLSWQMQMLAKEKFPRFELGVRGSHIGHFALDWTKEDSLLVPSRNEQVGLCLPIAEDKSHYENLSRAAEALNVRKIPFRTIPESQLTQEWDGLDVLFVLPESVSVEGKRKLMGFCAAGGQVVSMGNDLGLPEEISFQKWSTLLA